MRLGANWPGGDGTSRGYYKMWYMCVRVSIHAAEYVIDDLRRATYVWHGSEE